MTNQLNAAKVKAARAQKFIPSAPPAGTNVKPSVTALIAYCQNNI